MAAPNMATITASLERSLQNCSLNNHHPHHVHRHQNSSSSSSSSEGVVGVGRSSTSDSTENHHHLHHRDLSNPSDPTLELNSQISLPYHWEQCLDLKTGEIYYINWRTGMKANEDPRTTAEFSGDFYSEDDSSYESEGSSSESSPTSSRERYLHHHRQEQQQQQQEEEEEEEVEKQPSFKRNDQVLVVAGCKRCLMYYMVPKQVDDCPKCCGQLLHFDRSD